MGMMEGKVLLAVKDDNNADKYKAYLKDIIDFDVVSSLNLAYQNCLTNYYDLVLIDLKLSFGLGRYQIDKINSVSYSPPLIKIRPRENLVEVILPEQRAVEELINFLKKFFSTLREDKASSSSYINLRKYVRYKSILRVVITRENDPDPIRANTLDISQGGAFVTTVFPFQQEEKIIFDLFDISPEPIKVVTHIAWIRPWEVPHQLPGFGARFLSFADENGQYQLISYLNNSFQEKTKA